MIDNGAFEGCASLERVVVPDGVASIKGSTFSKCSKLKSVTIPKSVTSIRSKAFYLCGNLEAIDVPEGVTYIGINTFAGCKKIKSISLPEGVTRIRNSAFADSGITSLVIPSSVTALPKELCYNCTNLASVTIPASVTEIGSKAFYGCKGKLIIDSKLVENDYAPDKAPSKDAEHWLNGSKFSTVVVGKNVTKLGAYIFAGYASLRHITISDSVTSIGGHAVADTRVKMFVIPENVISIGCHAFSRCTGELVVNSKMIEADYTLDNAPSNKTTGWLSGAKFTKVTIGKGITKVGANAFAGCASIAEVQIPENVTSIGNSAFEGCAMSLLILPNGITSIGNSAFKGCKNLVSIFSEATTPPALGVEVFADCSPLCKVYVPSKSMGAYRRSWKRVIGACPKIEKAQ